MASSNYNPHPLPAPPRESGQQQLPQQYPYQQPVPVSQAPPVQKPERTRPKSRAFSFRSDKSHKIAANPHLKIDLHETSAEKEAKRLQSKADPSKALQEAEPAMQAQMEAEFKPAPLGSLQHKDSAGNPIAEPDRSNPTRSKWERPLDTIRSFEAAIDGGYKRNSFYRSDSDSVANWNRRSSYYGSEHECTHSRYPNFVSFRKSLDNGGPRFPQDSYYGGRPESAMLDPRQSAMMSSPRDSYQGGSDGPYGNVSRSRYSRMQSDPYLNSRGPPPERAVYPVPNNHRSYETVATGSGSTSLGEPAGYQTDPTSSENSSIDRRSPAKRAEPVNDYGISFGQSPAYQTPSFGGGNGAGAPPAVPRKDNGTLLKKVSNVESGRQERPETGEKRKSWLMRRLSKAK
ncbi:hypothetical protein F4778DRAFT_783110 [Xylariomycetidae sp. FL2044]|nr:hypothetical protein F4778DRAFT_783110 [Xylariomycetidae sp. FL2044]